MICRSCYKEIEAERLEILPKTCACAACATKLNLGGSGRKGRMIFDGKTGGTIQIMSEDLFEETKMYYEPVSARSVTKNFSKNIAA